MQDIPGKFCMRKFEMLEHVGLCTCKISYALQFEGSFPCKNERHNIPSPATEPSNVHTREFSNRIAREIHLDLIARSSGNSCY